MGIEPIFKHPDAELTYRLDWTEGLNDEIIASTTWELENADDDLVVTRVSDGESFATVKLVGGLDTPATFYLGDRPVREYRVVNKVTFASGLKDAAVLIVYVTR